MYDISYSDPQGNLYQFSERLWSVAVERAGISGMVGRLADSTVASAQWGGQVLEHQAPEPLKGTLTLVVYAETEHDVDDLYARLRAAFSPTRRGALNISGDRYGTHTAMVRLDGSIDPPDVDTAGEQFVAKIKIPLVADDGVWRAEPFADSGDVVVTNPSPVVMHVGAVWSAKSRVYLPSSWPIELPAVSGKRRVEFDPRTGYTVRDMDGVIDEATTRVVVKTAVPEPVPAGESRKYQTTGDAELTWQVPTLDPWL